MKTKQILGIVVAAAAVVVIGVTGVASNILQAKMTASSEKESFNLMEYDMTEELSLPTEDFVGQINIVGKIVPSTGDSVWGTTENTYDHDLYMEYVDQMIEADNNKGIMLYINSPGGNVYESDELYLKLMEYKEKTGRPIWAYFGSEACSGGYYIGMAADKIYANRNCWTGSIGVIVSLVNCKELYDKIGIKEIDITSGANKAMGSVGLDLTKEQYDILQSLVDEAYDQFVDIVATGRKMEKQTVKKLADGRIYSAKQALDAKLIDAIGSFEEEKAAFAKEAGWDEDITYFEPENAGWSFFTNLFGAIKDLKPQSELELATDIVENHGNGVLRYYAK